MRKTLLAVAVALISTCALAQEVTIKRVPKVGDSIKYRLKAELMIGEAKVEMTGVSVEKVIKVSEDGAYEIESTSSEGKVVMEERVYDSKSDPMVTSYRSTGDIVALKGTKIDSSVYRMSNLNAFRAPDKAVKIGDSWTREIAADAKTGAVAAKATYTFEGTENVGGITALKMKYAYIEAVDRNPANAEGFMWIHPQDGSLVKSEITVKNAPLPLQETVTAKLTVVRE